MKKLWQLIKPLLVGWTEAGMIKFLESRGKCVHDADKCPKEIKFLMVEMKEEAKNEK